MDWWFMVSLLKIHYKCHPLDYQKQIFLFQYYTTQKLPPYTFIHHPCTNNSAYINLTFRARLAVDDLPVHLPD